MTGVMTIKTGSTTATGSMSGTLNSAPVLPQTGAKETLLLIVALIVGLAIASGMHFRKKI
ncbi:LPXTG cell wall anchor domain-containing protein [Candidatus Peregrinibacteria bacterium]|jgi:LPXTG-motif cell wall-anchored protein|nr:LPXTG cell wall anchor domain-containing protein [Candidatus Peregrinibacteria bacterium]MCB9804956.1 LPXTG cell wall anchor domain-containing protein [Candidatus Peribacteria bacterium]